MTGKNILNYVLILMVIINLMLFSLGFFTKKSKQISEQDIQTICSYISGSHKYGCSATYEELTGKITLYYRSENTERYKNCQKTLIADGFDPNDFEIILYEDQ